MQLAENHTEGSFSTDEQMDRQPYEKTDRQPDEQMDRYITESCTDRQRWIDSR